MNHKTIRWSLFLALFAMVLFAQTNSEVDLFRSGVQEYQRGNYSRAQSIFLKVLKEYPKGKLITATKLMLAKTYYKLGDYSTVEIIASNFFKNHPGSNYLDDIHFLLGYNYFKQNKYDLALQEWFWVIENSTDPRLKKMAGNYLYQTLLHNIPSEEFPRIKDRFSNAFMNGLIQVVQSKKLIQQGRIDEAKNLLKNFLKQNPNHFYAEEAKRLLHQSETTLEEREVIVYMKPTSEELMPVGEAFEKGMQYALWEYQTRQMNSGIGLQSIGIGGTVLSAISALDQFIKEKRPLAVIGPIGEDQSAATALYSRYEKIPNIIPLNSQNGLAAISPYVFQLNPDVEIKGRFLGEYATQELGLKHIAVLAPVNEYGKSFYQSFLEAVQANGGEVVIDQWYYESTQDFSRQFKAIRKKAFWISFMDSLSQVDSTFSDEQIQEKYQQYLERIFGENRPGIKIDSTQVPATGIDGLLLLVTSPDIIEYMAPQFAFHNIQTTLLGNEGWNDPEMLLKFKQYLDGMVYITAGYYEPDSWNYKEFMTRFRQKMHDTPEIYHLLGYDTMKWILSNYRNGMNRTEFKSQLEKAPLYKGILENIRFGDKPRVNNQLIIIKLSIGQFIRLN